MNHLLADLMRYHDPYWAVLVPVVALPGAAILFTLLNYVRKQRGWRQLTLASGLGVGATGMCLVIIWAALKSSYPHIDVSIVPAFALKGIATCFASCTVAACIAVMGRRSGRNVLLAGSLMSFGFSCMSFQIMSGMVSPYALSYDLTAVMLVMVVTATLSGFSIWENGNTAQRHSLLFASLLATGSVTVAAFGFISSILAFGDWMNAFVQPDDITSSPLVAIAAFEALVVLALGLLGSLVDNRTAARDQLEADRLRQLADSTFESLLIHKDGIALDGNQALVSLLGIRRSALAGLELRSLVPDGGMTFWTKSVASQRIEADILNRNGTRLPVEMLSRRIQYRGVSATVTALRDISERRASEARIRFLAHHDMLTELPNRMLLKEELERIVGVAKDTQNTLAVLCLDLDGFKVVNDTFGHAAGDELLRQVAERLRRCLSKSEFVARIGGDEFVVLQSKTPQPWGANDLAQRIIASLTAVFDIDGHTANIGTSIGIAVHPRDGDEPAHLLKRADIALYRAKHSGRGCLRFFDAAIDAGVDDRPQLEKELRTALDSGDLSLAYQPIYDVQLRLVCFEALMRWKHPILGNISPTRFIPIAEERGLIGAMGAWALRQACAAAAAWPTDCRIAVNLSPMQVLQKDLAKDVAAILADTGLAPERLELEVTEGVLLQDTEGARLVLEQLSALGVRIVLDDFGTGYSSLSYLHRFPFRKLKIDRSFVHRIGDDRSARAIVKAVVSMSRDLGIEINAEGVETTGQFQELLLQGCDEMQGFLLGKPMAIEEAEGLLVAQCAERSLEQLRTVIDQMHPRPHPLASTA